MNIIEHHWTSLNQLNESYPTIEPAIKLFVYPTIKNIYPTIKLSFYPQIAGIFDLQKGQFKAPIEAGDSNLGKNI